MQRSRRPLEAPLFPIGATLHEVRWTWIEASLGLVMAASIRAAHCSLSSCAGQLTAAAAVSAGQMLGGLGVCRIDSSWRGVRILFHCSELAGEAFPIQFPIPPFPSLGPAVARGARRPSTTGIPGRVSIGRPTFQLTMLSRTEVLETKARGMASPFLGPEHWAVVRTSRD